MKKYITLSILAFFTFLLISGCYTIVNHPGEEDGYSYTGGETDCVRCHPNYHDDYGYSHYYYPNYWSTHDRWGRYYAVPWWWDYYWYDDDSYYYGDNDGYTPRSSHGEKATRPSSRYEKSPGISAPNITRGSSWNGGSSSGSSSTKSSKTTSDDNSSDNQKEVKTKSEKEDDNTTKRTGRWKKK